MAMTRPVRRPLRTRSSFPAPRFCAVKLETPLPSVVKQVRLNVLSLTAAEYPAITDEPKPLTSHWMKMLPTEMKLCCRMLGMATLAICISMRRENRSACPST